MLRGRRLQQHVNIIYSPLGREHPFPWHHLPVSPCPHVNHPSPPRSEVGVNTPAPGEPLHIYLDLVNRWILSLSLFCREQIGCARCKPYASRPPGLVREP